MILFRSPTLFHLLLVTAITPTGCSFKARQIERRREQVVLRSGDLYRGYLTGEVTSARACLLSDAKQVEDATILEPRGRAQLLRETYYRLYVLEKRCGNQPASEAALVKARFWALKYGELIGIEIGKAMDQIREDTEEHITKHVDDSDKSNNDGKQPRYLESLGKISG